MPTHTTIESFSKATGFSPAMIKAHRITESDPHLLDPAALPTSPTDADQGSQGLKGDPETYIDRPEEPRRYTQDTAGD